jgi:hypothetical protein
MILKRPSCRSWSQTHPCHGENPLDEPYLADTIPEGLLALLHGKKDRRHPNRQAFWDIKDNVADVPAHELQGRVS